MSSIILTTFNNHFAEFVDDVYSIFPTNVDVLTAKGQGELKDTIRHIETLVMQEPIVV